MLVKPSKENYMENKSPMEILVFKITEYWHISRCHSNSTYERMAYVQRHLEKENLHCGLSNKRLWLLIEESIKVIH